MIMTREHYLKNVTDTIKNYIYHGKKRCVYFPVFACYDEQGWIGDVKGKT